MPAIYCVCDATPISVCSCIGTSYSGLEGDQNAGDCSDYTSGEIETREFTNTNTCDSYVAPTTVDSSYSFNGAYYSVMTTNDKISKAQLDFLWDGKFTGWLLPHFKNLPVTYSKPSDIQTGNIIKANHFEDLRRNLIGFYSSATNYKLITGQGYIEDKNGSTKIANYQNDIGVNNFNPGNTVKADDYNKLYTWLLAAYANCECVMNNMLPCCYCDVVCDCNY